MKNLIVLATFQFLTISILSQPFINTTTSFDTIIVNQTETEKVLNITEKKIIHANTIFPDSYKQHTSLALPVAEKYIREKRNYINSTYKKGKSYYKTISKILKRYKLPDELKVLVAIESNFTPNLVSSAGAYGWWQFMDETALEMGLKIKPILTQQEIETLIKNNDTVRLNAINKMVDDRTDLIKSTNAAAKYLKQRYNSLHDWLLAVASYNAGEGTVRNAMRRCGKPNPTFWDIKPYLPTETQNYVIKFIGITAAYNNLKNFDSGKMTFADTETITKRKITVYSNKFND